MATTSYTTIDGEIISENRGGVERDYMPDPLGSTLALLDNTQTKTDTFTYWPYGQVKTRTGTTVTPFQYIGTRGYYQDSSTKSYVRARYLDTQKSRWMTVDPIGFEGGDWNLYGYSSTNPVSQSDPNGLKSAPCRLRTLDYCDKSRSHECGNRAENCFCRVSNLICNLIVNTKGSEQSKRLDCLNKCMHENWKSRGGDFGGADAICKENGISSKACCKATISAEQKGFTACNDTKCKGIGKIPRIVFPFPFNGSEQTRIQVGQHYCCKGGLFGDPLPPGYPRNRPGYFGI